MCHLTLTSSFPDSHLSDTSASPFLPSRTQANTSQEDTYRAPTNHFDCYFCGCVWSSRFGWPRKEYSSFLWGRSHLSTVASMQDADGAAERSALDLYEEVWVWAVRLTELVKRGTSPHQSASWFARAKIASGFFSDTLIEIERRKLPLKKGVKDVDGEVTAVTVFLKHYLLCFAWGHSSLTLFAIMSTV